MTITGMGFLNTVGSRPVESHNNELKLGQAVEPTNAPSQIRATTSTMSRAATSTYLPGATRLPQGGIKGRIDALASKLGSSRFIKPILDKAIKKQQQALTAQADEIARAANESKVKAESKENNTGSLEAGFTNVNDVQLGMGNTHASNRFDPESLSIQADDIARTANQAKAAAGSKEKNTGSLEAGFTNVNDIQLGMGNIDADHFFDPELLNDPSFEGDSAPQSRPKLNRDTLDRNINSTKDFEDSPAPTSTSRI